MRLSEALETVHSSRRLENPFAVRLVCGFTPLHLETFLAAHLQRALPLRRVETQTGLFGDLAGSLERSADADAIAIALEWADLDPRLGYRSLGGWGPAEEADILRHTNASLQRILAAIEKLNGTPVAISTPTLLPAPAFHTAGWETSACEAELDQAVGCFATAAARQKSVSLVNARRLAMDSPFDGRFDLKSELASGFPYTLAHADQLGRALARLIQRPAPKKGLITDLDGTLWKGIVGEVNPEGVSWDLASHSLAHGLYQQLLRALAASGVLVAVASKNDPAVVERTFARPDMVLQKDNVFPIEVHWNAKSASVGRILEAWNIGADSVVFVDDSPMELAEVKAAWPAIETLQFPVESAGIEPLLRTLRDLFGKPEIGAEDALRMESLRKSAEFRAQALESGGAPEEFLEQAGARITVHLNPPASDSRVLELVNKTNQFNLNGRRYAEAEWRKQADAPGGFVFSVSYEDKFGPLGKIAVLAGVASGETIDVTTWVMSCRAFSRRIEDRCLEILFEKLGARQVRIAFAPTAKNGPASDAFERYLGAKPSGAFSITREQLDRALPKLYHSLEWIE